MNAFKCHRARVNFELYLDGGLSPEDCEALEQHLFECSACASVVGDDIQLGEAIEKAGDVAIHLRPGSARVPPSGRLRTAAAAAILLIAGAAIGHFVPSGQAKQSEAGSVKDLVPLTELVDEPEIGFASFTDNDVLEAEREGLRSRVGQSEWRARRIEAEMDLMRPLLEETATPERVVERLADRVRQMAPGPPPRPPRDDRERMRGGPFHQVHVAASLLRRDPQGAFEPVAAWLKSARTPFERQSAVKLLACLRLPQAHDLLVAELREGPARELALDGLVALRDPRSHDLFASMLDDERLPLDQRIKAAGGLHRLADPRGLDFLVKTFRAHNSPSDQPLLRRILLQVGANPGRETAEALPELLKGVRLESRAERSAMAEWLTLSGMSDGDPALLRLVETGPVERDGGRPNVVPVMPARP